MTPLVQERAELSIDIEGPAMIDITAKVRDWLRDIGARDGLLTLFLRHTSASLTIQEAGDPKLRADLLSALTRLLPSGAGVRQSGSDRQNILPAHIKALLASVSLSVPVFGSDMALGALQGIFLIEHRARQGARGVLLHFVGALS